MPKCYMIISYLSIKQTFPIQFSTAAMQRKENVIPVYDTMDLSLNGNSDKYRMNILSSSMYQGTVCENEPFPTIQNCTNWYAIEIHGQESMFWGETILL